MYFDNISTEEKWEQNKILYFDNIIKKQNCKQKS